MVKVSFRQKLCIVLPITGSVCLNLAVAGGILKFYTDYVGLSPIYYGIAYILFGIWNGINDPVFGYYLTKHQPKPGKGKYRKVMLRAIPLLVLSYIILITMSPSLSQISLFIILIIGLFLYDATYTLFL